MLARAAQRCLSSRRCMGSLLGHGQHLLLPKTAMVPTLSLPLSMVRQPRGTQGPHGGAVGRDAIVSGRSCHLAGQTMSHLKGL